MRLFYQSLAEPQTSPTRAMRGMFWRVVTSLRVRTAEISAAALTQFRDRLGALQIYIEALLGAQLTAVKVNRFASLIARQLRLVQLRQIGSGGMWCRKITQLSPAPPPETSSLTLASTNSRAHLPP
jgi:hypothetical protein